MDSEQSSDKRRTAGRAPRGFASHVVVSAKLPYEQWLCLHQMAMYEECEIEELSLRAIRALIDKAEIPACGL